jgi:sulfur carrier protein
VNPELVLPKLSYPSCPRLVAVEYNGEILHRQFWSQTQIKEDDKIEIVTIVGGGAE